MTLRATSLLAPVRALLLLALAGSVPGQDPPVPVPVPVPTPVPAPTPAGNRPVGTPAPTVDARQDAETQRVLRLQAAFLRQMALYCRWPPSVTRGRREFVVGVVGHDPFGKILEETFGEEPLNGMRVLVRRFSADTRDIARALSGCQVVWVAVLDDVRCGEIITAMAQQPVQLVGDHPRFVRLGGMVQMFEQENRIRFHVAREVAQKAGIEFSSQLLQLSREVPERPAAEVPSKVEPGPKPDGEVGKPPAGTGDGNGPRKEPG